jgi:hypothetical protein
MTTSMQRAPDAGNANGRKYVRSLHEFSRAIAAVYEVLLSGTIGRATVEALE